METPSKLHKQMTENHDEPVAWIGIDWGDRKHAYVLRDRHGKYEEGTLENTSERLHEWLKKLEQRWKGYSVFLAVESNRGALFEVLIQYHWLRIYPINPLTSFRFRNAFTPSRASDDLPDARVLLEILVTHHDKLRLWEQQDSQTRQLDALNRLRRDIVDRRTQITNQIGILLKGYYPQALALIGELNLPLACDFLLRWPDLISLKAARAATIRKFYYDHNLRRPELVEKRLKLIKESVPLTTEEVKVSTSVMQLTCLLEQLLVLNRHINKLEADIKSVFKDHPEAYLFRDLPGAGKCMAPRLCALFGTDRTLYPEATNLLKLSGVAPVVERSGKQSWTHWRRLAPKFMRQTVVEWAGLTIGKSTWATIYYNRMKARGKKHGAILRALAFKWIRVLWKCWMTHTAYDENRYLLELQRRKSPNAMNPET